MHRRGGEENAEPELIEVTFADLRNHYIRIACDGVRAPLDAELVEDYLQSYFVAADGGEEVADYKWYKGRTGDSANLQSILGLTILDAERLRKTQRRGKHATSTLQSFSLQPLFAAPVATLRTVFAGEGKGLYSRHGPRLNSATS